MSQSPSQKIIGRKLENQNINLTRNQNQESNRKFPIQVNDFLNNKQKQKNIQLHSNKHKKAKSINI